MEDVDVAQMVLRWSMCESEMDYVVSTFSIIYVTKKWLRTKLKMIWNLRDQIEKNKGYELNWKTNKDKGPKYLFFQIITYLILEFSFNLLYVMFNSWKKCYLLRMPLYEQLHEPIGMHLLVYWY